MQSRYNGLTPAVDGGRCDVEPLQRAHTSRRWWAVCCRTTTTGLHQPSMVGGMLQSHYKGLTPAFDGGRCVVEPLRRAHTNRRWWAVCCRATTAGSHQPVEGDGLCVVEPQRRAYKSPSRVADAQQSIHQRDVEHQVSLPRTQPIASTENTAREHHVAGVIRGNLPALRTQLQNTVWLVAMSLVAMSLVALSPVALSPVALRTKIENIGNSYTYTVCSRSAIHAILPQLLIKITFTINIRFRC